MSRKSGKSEPLRPIGYWAFVVFLLLVSAGGLPALTVKMGTVAPANTPWDTALKKVAADWARISNGRVNVRLYPGAIVGDENDMIRQLRLGQLQAAALSTNGLGEIVDDVMVLEIPFLFTSAEQTQWVLDRLTPEFQKLFQEKGFALLGWSIAGWVQIFSREKVVAPADLMKMKLAIPIGTDPAVVSGWQKAGFRVLPVAIPDLMTALSSGMVDALYTEPLAAAAYQWFGVASHMSQIKLAPLIGGFVVSERAWQQIPPECREPFRAAVEQAEKPILGNMTGLEKSAMEVMLENGLVVSEVPPAAAWQWRTILTDGFRDLAGRSYSAAMYDRVLALVDEYSATHP